MEENSSTLNTIYFDSQWPALSHQSSVMAQQHIKLWKSDFAISQLNFIQILILSNTVSEFLPEIADLLSLLVVGVFWELFLSICK